MRFRRALAVAQLAPASASGLTLTFPAAFAPHSDFATGANPQSVAMEDLNGDGKPDLVVANETSNNVSVLLGTGAGSFSAASNFAAGMNPFSVAVGDFNGDGKPDLAVANFSSNNVSVLLGTGAGSFSAASNFAAGMNPSGTVKFTMSAARATLSRRGVIYAAGAASRRGLVLHAQRRVRAGRYTLTLRYRRGHHQITTRGQITID